MGRNQGGSSLCPGGSVAGRPTVADSNRSLSIDDRARWSSFHRAAPRLWLGFGVRASTTTTRHFRSRGAGGLDVAESQCGAKPVGGELGGLTLGSHPLGSFRVKSMALVRPELGARGYICGFPLGWLRGLFHVKHFGAPRMPAVRTPRFDLTGSMGTGSCSFASWAWLDPWPLSCAVRGGSSELPFEPAPVSSCRFRSRLPSRVSHCLPPSRHRHDHRWARRLSFPGRACAFHVNHGGALPELRLAVLTIAGVVSREPKKSGASLGEVLPGSEATA